MRPAKLVAAGAALLLLATLAPPFGPSAQGEPRREAATYPEGPWRYPSEQVWLVTEVLRNLGGLAEFARSNTATGHLVQGVLVEATSPPSLDEATFLVQSSNAEPFRVALYEHIFSPLSYDDVARRWLGPRESPQETSIDRHLPARLLDLRLSTLQAANLELSRALTDTPSSADNHEDAAFLLAAFELREASAGHSDPRRVLARITAHLALARALRDGDRPNTNGHLAEIAVLVMAGRTAEAVSRLEEATTSDGPAVQTWKRALRLFATEDWRAFAWTDGLTLIEKFAWLSAFHARVGSDRVHSFVRSLSEEEQRLPDWGRRILRGWPSVQDCEAFALGGVAKDLEEAQEASRLMRGVGIAPDGLADALNEEAPPSPVRDRPGGPVVEVLDWGIMAAFLQRHIAARLNYEVGCHAFALSMPWELARILNEQEARFGGLALFPPGAPRWARTRDEYLRHIASAARLIRQRPELVAPHMWLVVLEEGPFGSPVGVPMETDWLSPPMPFGTYFREGRLYGPTGKRKLPAVLFDALVQRDPYDSRLRWAYSKQTMGPRPPYPSMIEAFGPALAWDVRAMQRLADLATDGHPKERRRWLTQACEIEGDFCADLAALLIGLGEAEAAAKLYRRYWREGTDRIAVANRMEWLVDYEREHGELDSAFEIARDVAATDSRDGLRTLASLAEETGGLDEAEKALRRIAERHAGAEELFAFYGRRIAAGEMRYEASRDRLLEEVFPGGFEMTDEQPPAGPPVDGVFLTDVEERARDAGFAEGDIAVALDGVRIRSRQQWRILRDRSIDPEMRVLIYRAGAYREVRGRFPGRIIPAFIDSYPKTR